MALIAAFILCYAVDWLVYKVRAAHGTAFGSVTVSQFIAVPLKDNKMEYDYAGQQPVTCVRSIFPWADNDPCWWVKRHSENWSKP